MDDPESRFTRMYDTYYRRVLAYALTHAEPHTAEDIVSETFLIAWRRLGDVRDPALPWLLGTARNLVRKQYDHGRRGRVLAERIRTLTTPQDLAAWDVAEHVVERDVALAAIAGLPERDLEVLALVNWHGLEPRQAARVLGCTSAAFFVRLHRARRRLTRALEQNPAPRSAVSRVAERATS
ncbi:sigma-70 family RNA polymerase sigma factor [Actinomadura kijaniata]|uniref:RNA polymerase sigma-70 factor (ECF subfamily) n=1 Tax=Actinomadura namibiensis TaxID=182080 RepID=A0A7W3QNJ0_ACTNM|nr:sigma-70 family RNA polymerase sigma factor [Actinomadura namibiensis]MBA8953669.1 RNA polymerase sigma-70 factor (ECF subfamily) [Actinomadura namibiensis]